MCKMTTWLLVSAACTLLAVAGCGKDDPGSPASPLPPVPEKPTLMENFRAAYEQMDYGAYEALLDPDFKTFLTADTINAFSLPADHFDCDEERTITQHMFSGDAVMRPNGEIVPGIVAIEFMTFFAEDDWVQTQPDDRIPDAWRAPFRVDIVFHQGSRDMRVQGKIHFYLKEVEVDGATGYRLVGQVDETSQYPAKPTEGWSWGTVKALFR